MIKETSGKRIAKAYLNEWLTFLVGFCCLIQAKCLICFIFFFNVAIAEAKIYSFEDKSNWNSSFTSQLLCTLSKLITSLSLSVFTCKNGDGDTYCIVFSGELCLNNKYKVLSTVTEKKTNVNSLPPKRVILDGWMDGW